MRSRGTTGYNIIVMHISAVVGGYTFFHIISYEYKTYINSILAVIYLKLI